MTGTTPRRHLTIEQEAALLELRDRQAKRYPHPSRLPGSTDVEVASLEHAGLIEPVPGGYVLSPAGRDALRWGARPGSK